MMSRLSRTATFVFLLFLTLGLSACTGSSSTSTGTLPPPVSTTEGQQGAATLEPGDYVLAAGDKLRINVFRHEDLSGEFELDGRGNFSMPLIGQVAANGLTSTELEQRIADKLKDGYLVDPQVSIEVLTYRPFYILGEVNKPGEYEHQASMTLEQAIAKAGGYTRRADTGTVVLRRNDWNSGRRVRLSGEALMIAPGDTITVKEAFF
ncbi:MAG: polysaccharide export protein [Geminicoccaceae bacterium]|nr:polysaccharide export protein [Geminicoccaceae bacterium]